MLKTVSIAQARHALAALVHELEQRRVIELTRRGKPVAVLLSISEYNRLRSSPSDLLQSHLAFRERLQRAEIDIEPDIWRDVRDPSPGREIDLS